jgi:leucyl-tRNA synthetase
MWKSLGKESLAVKAPWPIAEEEDKILTRQAKLLRDSLKHFRTQVGKAKKGWQKASILVSDAYPQWKIDVLTWMQEQYKGGNFPDSFIKDLKGWAAANVSDKKMVKFTMQFASFRKNEVEEVGSTALDIRLPFDQKVLFEENIRYIQSQLNIPEIDVINLVEDANDVPDRVAENVEPGKPVLWLR